MIKKIVLLSSLLILLAILVHISFGEKINRVEHVTIVDKYYPESSDGKAVGLKTDKVIDVSKNKKGYNCAMEFDNGKISELDCSISVNYKIGEKVYITSNGNQIAEIRRKK
ncbi:hypothetical protein [Peribacillus loiseleuriae]|uniref:Uncharacterized protein n=1 Tax=Peribacillus loiseleuriae TaxID=1679170 RepID=A0A0K9GYH3_9BACI|nr:hypothetical protein [Peribacillus loiseleuriae]KMY51655.1 hypothetical protein AC625_20745 [Peribacillus loiseleuriae]